MEDKGPLHLDDPSDACFHCAVGHVVYDGKGCFLSSGKVVELILSK